MLQTQVYIIMAKSWHLTNALEEWYIAFYTAECPESPQWGILVSDFNALPFFRG